MVFLEEREDDADIPRNSIASDFVNASSTSIEHELSKRAEKCQKERLFNPPLGDIKGPFRAAMRWTNVMSGFVLRSMCQLISTGVRTDKGFKEVHLNQVAKSLHEFSGNEVTSTQVYNHLRKWRQRWIRVTKVRELSGALWDEDNFMITLEDEHYKGHIKAHLKDANLLNKPIENYQQMQIIFGNGLATGKFAMGSGEALGSPSDFAESSVKVESNAMKVDDVPKIFGEAPKTQNASVGSGSNAGNKKKRCMLSEGDIVVMTGMTDAVNNITNAILQTKIKDVHPELYGVVMFMPRFIEEALMAAYSHLLDNKAHGTVFVKMNDSHRVLWLRTFLAKHYYI
ncbi:uncharacterized protein LOC101757975 [Setaria italica]|uniref:uncharacterized protein LOC101757975 n=1 Tax=Setaria italica TaxID=4555 RepID=UPI000647F4C5|nr:uncharacterized protein LOC101757975 [Setaria italica]